MGIAAEVLEEGEAGGREEGRRVFSPSKTKTGKEVFFSYFFLFYVA